MAGLFGSGFTVPDPDLFAQGARSMSRLQELQRANQNRLNQSRVLQTMPDMGATAYGSGPAFGDLAGYGSEQRQITVPAPEVTVTEPLRQPDATMPPSGPNVTRDDAGNITNIEPAVTGTSTQRLTNPEYATGQPSHLTIPDYDPENTTIDWGLVNMDLNSIADGLATGRYGYGSAPINRLFGESSPEIDAQREAAGEAAQWFRSDEAARYFTQNPDAVQQARLDPVGFYQAFQNEAPLRAERRTRTASSERTDRLITGRANRMADALQTPQVQTLIQQAQAMGVDPYAAIAIYGIESDFGANAGTSSAGAAGGMQVIDSTFRSMKNWFTDEGNIEQYNIPQSLVAIARGIQRGDALSEMQAGLLYIKYNELIGNPVNLWGAGYQGSADSVRRLGRPINADDGNITNADYNRAYVELYNHARTILGGQGSGIVAPPTAAPSGNAVAGVPNFTQPAPVTSAQSANTGNVAVGTGNASSLQVVPPASTTQPRTEPVAGVTVGPVRLPDVQTSAFYLENPGRISQDTTAAMQARQRIAYQAQLQQRLARVAQATGDMAGYSNAVGTLMQTEAALREADNQIVYYQGMQALSELNMGNTNRASAVYSYVTGRNVRIVPRSDGNYDITVEGQVWKEGMSPSELSTQLRLEFDNAFRQQRAQVASERSQFTFEAQLEAALERQQALVEGMTEQAVERLKIQGDLALEQLKQSGATVSSLGNGLALVVQGGQTFLFDPMGREYTDQNGDQQIDYSLRPINPVATASSGTGNPYLDALNRQ